MNFKNIVKLSFLEIIRFKKTSAFLILNFALGLVGFFLLQIFQQSLTNQTAEKAQILLGGDISVSARRQLQQEEVQKWESLFSFKKKTHFVSLFSMIRSKNESRLANVAVFDSNYPLYGEFKISGQSFSEDKAKVWVDPEVQELFQLKDGDHVEIGESSFLFAGVIIEDPTRMFKGTGFAPRVLIHQKYLNQADLIKPGSTMTDNWLYSLMLPASDPGLIKKQIENVISDPIIQIESATESAQDSNRVLKYFTDYLGLVALVALGLCFLCGNYLFQWTFNTKKKNIAIFKTLGLSDRKILVIYSLQCVFIAFVSSVLTVGFVQLLLLGLQNLITHQFQLPLIVAFNLKSVVSIFLVGIIGPLLMTIPQVIQIFNLQALELFQNVQLTKSRGLYFYLWAFLSLLLFWILSIWQSHSLKLASSFVGVLIALIILFYFLNRFILWALEKGSSQMSWLLKYSIKGLTRRKDSSSLVFTTMSLATLVLSLLPHIKSSILSEIRPEQSSQIPQLFLFDIQPEQVDAIQNLAKNILKTNLKFNPLVRSRILKINDQPYERLTPASQFQTREEETEARFRNRGVNLTYRSELQNSETLIKGQFLGTFHSADSSLAEISLEDKYADRVGVHLNDIMTFDIQGLEMKAKVTSFRQVRWTSFQPNFFILFPKNVLEEAPQIFLTSVNQSSELTKDEVKKFQQQVAEKFKNVSIIDIRHMVESSLVYIDQMSLGLQMMAWLAVLVGIFVFIVLLNTQIRERLSEMNMIQILGATQADLKKSIFIQFFILMIISIVSGVLLGLIVARFLMSYFFEIQTVYDLQYLLLLGIVILPITTATIFIGLVPLQRLNPIDLIRQA